MTNAPTPAGMADFEAARSRLLKEFHKTRLTRDLMVNCDDLHTILYAAQPSAGEGGEVKTSFVQGYEDGYEDCAAGHDKDPEPSWAAHVETQTTHPAPVLTAGAEDICERLDAILVEEDRMHPIGCASWEEEGRVAIDMAKDAIRDTPVQPDSSGVVEALREALADVAYAPGDHPIVPIKHDAFVTHVQAIVDLAALAPVAAEGGEKDKLRTLLDNLVIAQGLSKAIREHATNEARAYLCALRTEPTGGDA
jgi:hypothetical protein